MPIRNLRANEVLQTFLAENVHRNPTLRDSDTAEIRLSPIFEVRSLTASEVAEALRTESAAPLGWWAFVLRGNDVVGIAELTLADDAIVYGGLNMGKRGEHAAEALARAEELVGQRDATVWFLRIAELFFTAVVIDFDGMETTIPFEGSLQMETLSAFAASRIEAATKLAAEIPRPAVGQK
jgi:hypothetical protein